MKAFVDNGNTTFSGAVISQKLMNQLGAKHFNQNTGKIKSVTGNVLKRIGTSEELEIEIQGMNEKFKIRPTVLEKMHDDLNLGTIFLQQNNAEIKLTPKGNFLKIKGNPVQMISRLEEENESNQEKKEQVLSEQQTTLKPRTVTFVKIKKEDREVLTEPLCDTAVCQLLPALYKQPSRIAVLNESDKAIKIKQGTPLGFLSKGSQTQLNELKEDKSDKAVHGQYDNEEYNELDGQFQSVVEGLKINDKKLLKENPAVKERLKRILFRYRRIFSEPGDIENEVGLTDLIEFKVKLKEDAEPKRTKPRPLNPDQRKSLKAQIDKWLKQGQIRECDSPWAAPLVPAKKAGEVGVIRWAVDFRDINAKTVSSSYPLPRISDNLEKLGGAKYFSTLDASSAYNTIPVAKDSQKYLSFCSFLGTFCYQRMPFGHKNSPSTYARFVDLCLQRLRSEQVLAYLDDIIVFNKTLNDHLDEIEKVFKMHEEAGIKLRAKKTYLFEEQVNYLGYTVSEEGIKMREDYVEQIINWPMPETGKAMQKFLGFCGYYCAFITQFSKLTCEMQACKKLTIIPWTKEMKEKFKQLKEKFKEKPVRRYPIFDKKYPFKLTTDFSQIALAGVLSQEVPNKEGKLEERFLGCAARKTTTYEQNYGSVKGELAALIFSIRKFEHLLRYNGFIVETDAQALKYLRTIKEPRGVYFRWLEELAGYEFQVKHKQGKLNINADALSRTPGLPAPTTEEEEEEAQEFVLSVQEFKNRYKNYSTRYIKQFGSTVGDVLSEDSIRTAQFRDPTLKLVRTWKMNGAPPEKKDLYRASPILKNYVRILDSISINPDTQIMYTKHRLNKIDKIYKRIILPLDKHLLDRVFFYVHQSKFAAHFGRQATLLRASERFYFPNMANYLNTRIKKCATCLAKTKNPTLKDAIHKPMRFSYPGEKLFIDLVGPLPEASDGSKYLLTVQDGFTGYSQAYPIKNKEAEPCAQTFLEKWVCINGVPESIHSDKGGEFESRFWHELCKVLQIKKETNTAYSPWQNKVERWHRTLNAMMRIFLDREDKDWIKHIGTACLAYNTKVRNDGYSPFELWFGRRCQLPIDLIIPLPTRRFNTVDESLRETVKRFNLMYEFVKERQEVQIARNQTLYTGKKNTFQDGDHVWVYISRKVVGKPDKLTDSWTGPWKIHKVVNDVLVQVKPALYEGKVRTVHVTRVRNYYEPKDIKSHQIPENLDEADDVDDGDELAEDLHPGEQIREPRDLLLPVEAPMPIEEIKDIAFKRPNLPQKEVPTITPIQAQEEHSLNISNEDNASHMESSSPSENDEKDISMPELEPTPHQSEETNSPKGGIKRKHAGTPSRSQTSRRTRTETAMFKRPITPPSNPKQPKNLKKSESRTSLMKEAKKLVSTILPTTSDSEDTEKPGCSNIGGRPKKIEVDTAFEKRGYENNTSSSDSDDTIGVQTIKQECDQSNTRQPIFIRASKNTRVVPNSEIVSIPCQVTTNVPANSFLTFSECPTLVRKGLILRPAIIPALDKEEFYLKGLTTSTHFDIKKGQRIGVAFVLKQI